MELAWETDHDHVSESAGTENASIGNVFEMKGRVDLGLKAPGCWAFGVAGGAAVALSYLLKKMTQQAGV